MAMQQYTDKSDGQFAVTTKSKEELATQIGISVKTYYNWLNGVNPIPSTALIKMSDIFGVTIDYLLNRDEQRKAV